MEAVEVKRRRPRTTLDPRDVQRAIYLDFEGTAVERPTLLGVLVDDEFVQFVFEPALEPAAAAKSLESGGTCRFASAPDALAALRHRIEQEQRAVFAWSSRERDAILDLVDDPDERAFWEHTVTNAIPLAKAWKSRHHRHIQFTRGPRGRSGRNTLDRYLALIGYRVPRIHGPGNTAGRIRFVRAALAKRGSFDALTAVQKKKWTNLLAHNWHDCAGLRALVEHVALDTPGRAGEEVRS